MKKSRLLLVAGAVAVFLSAGSAVAAPVHGGHHYGSRPTVTYVQSAPRPAQHHGGGHHNVVHHHHHHHNNTAGNIILATAILVSAFM